MQVNPCDLVERAISLTNEDLVEVQSSGEVFIVVEEFTDSTVGEATKVAGATSEVAVFLLEKKSFQLEFDQESQHLSLDASCTKSA